MEKEREHFPLLRKRDGKGPLIYLDSAATALKPRCVVDTMSQFYAEEYGTVHRAVYDLASRATEKYSSVRQIVQAFLNASSPDEIIFTKGATEAINLVASSFGKAFLKPGDQILLTEMEHHSNIVPWQMLSENLGIEIRFISMDQRGELVLEELDTLLNERTKLVCLAHIANATGTLNPLEKIIGMAHAKGARVLVDGAQSAAHLSVDVQKLDADFFVFSGHKAFGPTGVGVLYGKRELLERMPPYQGGSDMIKSVGLRGATYQMPPLRFEAGTPMIAEVIGLGVALRYIESVGRERIAAWEGELLEYATRKLLQIDGLRLRGTAPQKGAILSFTVEGVHPLDLGTLLNLKGVSVRTGHLCAQLVMERFGVSSMTRASFALYNTFEEIDCFDVALRESLSLLR